MKLLTPEEARNDRRFNKNPRFRALDRLIRWWGELEQDQAPGDLLDQLGEFLKFEIGVRENQGAEQALDGSEQLMLTDTLNTVLGFTALDRELAPVRSRPVLVEEMANSGGMCPSQWTGVTRDGEALYCRYRWGRLTVEVAQERIYVKQLGDSFHGAMTYIELIQATAGILTLPKRESEGWRENEAEEAA